MENKVLKKILVMAIVFVIMFSNCGVTLQALATSDGISIFGFSLFGNNVLDYKAYFLDENGHEKDEMTADVNGEMTLVLELEPKETGYLKSGTIKAITDEGEPNFEFKEILNLSTDSEEEALEQTVQLEQTLLKTEQVINTELPEVELNSVEEEVLNTVSEQNTVQNDVVQEEQNAVVEEPTVQETPTEIPEESEVLVDEDVAYQEEIEEKEQEESDFVSLSSAKVNTADEIVIENIIEPTKIFVKLAYKAGETVKVSDLYKETSLELMGKFINEDLEESEVSVQDKITTEWTYTKDIAVSSEITKVSPFEVEGTKGTLVESTITVNRDCTEENYLPLKETVIELKAPEINGKLPMTLDISANKLKATRGEEIGEVSFSSENWSYNQDNNIITIKVENPDAILTSGEDIYKIIYRYDEYVESEEITVEINGTVTIEEFSGKENNKITKEILDKKTSIVNIGELITYSIGTTEEGINRGKINANYNSVEAVYETEFTSTVSINVLTNDVLKEFTLKDTKEFYVDKANLEFETQDVKYKSIKFRYEEINEILNQGGIIEIKASTGELLYTLNRDLVKSQENCEIELHGDVHGVQISVKEIKVNGTITIDFVKVIGKCSYDKSAFNNFEKIESRIKAEVKYGVSDEVIELAELKTEKYFEKSYTRAEISMNKEELSTILDNEDVEIKIELNNHEETSDLYINPEFEVVFPSYVTGVEVQSVNLLYEEGLTVKNITLFKDEANIQRMKVQLEGVQRKFSTSTITNGTNVIINAKIIVDDYTPKKDDQLKMYYFNQGVTNYQAQTDWKISSEIPDGIIKTTNGFDVEVFSFKAPAGFITANGIENYDGLGSIIETIKQGEVTAKAEMGEISRVVTMNLAALNNTGNKCTEVVMLGRIPSVDSTDVITGKKLGTNRDTQLVSGIVQADTNPIGCDIYYSYRADATQAISDTNNAWTKTPEDMSQVKSFLIIPTSAVNEGTAFKFSYNFQVPANLPYDVEMYGAFGAYYNHHSDVAVVYESTKADLVGLVTDAGPRIDASLSVDIGDGAKIKGGRRLKYTITIVNSGSIIMNDLVIKAPVPENSVYVADQESNKDIGDYGFSTDASKEELTYSIDILNPGEVKEFSYYVQAGFKETLEQYADGKDENGYFKYNAQEKVYVTEVPKKVISNKVMVNSPLLVEAIESNEVKNEVEYVNFIMETGIDYDRTLDPGTETNFRLYVKNISGNELKAVEAVFYVGKVYEYNSASLQVKGSEVECDITFDSENGKVHFPLGNMASNATAIINLKVNAKKITTMKEEFDCRFEIKSEEMEKAEVGTVIPQKVEIPWIKAEDISINIPSTINEGDTIILSTKVDNISNRNVIDASYECEIPNCLEVVSVSTTENKNLSSVVTDGKVKDTLPMLTKDKSLTIDMKLKAKNMPGVDSTEVVLNRVVKNSNQEDMLITPIKFTVVNSEKTEEEIIEEEREEFEKAEDEYQKEQEKNETPEEDVEDNNNQVDNNETQEPDTNLQPDNNIVPEIKDEENNEQQDDNNQEPEVPVPTPEPEPEIVSKYSITGKAWYDENKNGVREDSEKGLSSVKVYLLDSNNRMIKSTTTNTSGIYTFEQLENGKYIVAFAYDTNMYVITTYKKANVTEDRNSDAIESNSEDIKAITNAMTIENSNIENVDIGLQNREIFDLQISKYISKIVVTTNKETKTYNYDNKDLAKIDIHSKQINGAKVELEYTVRLENKGSLAGNAEQVVDYLASNIEFDENKNKDWYKGNDGYIYIKNLNQVTLNPGEKKDYKLNVTKVMNEENTGVISNKVEILKAFSNSNEVEKTENNESVQNTIITVSTGRTLKTVIIFIFIIAILAGLGYKNKLPLNINFNKVYRTKEKNISLKKFYK